MAHPLVTVCTPTFRGAKYLPATIESVLGQTHSNWKLWIVDDNSPDDTEQVVRRYADKRISYVRNSSNLGPQGNWNRCLELAGGEYFKLLPHDDLLAPDCLELQVRAFERRDSTGVSLVFGKRRVIGPQGQMLMSRGPGLSGSQRVDGCQLVRRCIRSGANLIGEPGNGLLRTSAIGSIGPYDATHPYVVDLDYWFRLLATGDAFYTDSWSSSFRVSAGSWSVAIGNAQHRDYLQFVDRYRGRSHYGISALDVAIAKIRAPTNTMARTAIYRYLAMKGSMQ